MPKTMISIRHVFTVTACLVSDLSLLVTCAIIEGLTLAKP